MASGRVRSVHLTTWLALLLSVLTSCLLCCRSALPGNQHRELDLYRIERRGNVTQKRRVANRYDDSVAMTTAQNFAHEGFLRTHLLPNRGKFPLLSMYDRVRTQCEAISPPKHVQRYRDHRGREVDMVSLNNDCIYTHYPPLADWIFGVLAGMGLTTYYEFRVAAIVLNCAFLPAVFVWLRREVSAVAALLTVLLVATLPAYVRWADALYYHCMQYSLLVAGIAAWSVWLREKRRRWFLLAWLLYFCESLVSYELILMLAVVSGGILAMQRGYSWWQRARVAAVLATAPVSAVALHLTMQVSLLGLGRVWNNMQATIHNRVVDGFDSLARRAFLLRIREDLLRYDMIVLSLLLVVSVRMTMRMPLRRPLALLGLLFLGGATFMCVFPGTATIHGWMMYRHFMLFVVFLLALLIEGVPALGREVRRRVVTFPGSKVASVWLTALLVGSCVPIAWVSWRNGRELHDDFVKAGTRQGFRTLPPATANILDVVSWTENARYGDPDGFLLTVDGRRFVDYPGKVLNYELRPRLVLHDELWWLAPIAVNAVRFLTQASGVNALLAHCVVSCFDGSRFRSLPKGQLVTVEPFVPDPAEPAAPKLRWLSFAANAPRETRSVRLTCSELPEAVPLYELEIQ